MSFKLWIVVSSFFLWTACTHAEPIQQTTPTDTSLQNPMSSGAEEWQKFYTERYDLKNTNEKRVNNIGNGFEPLYGVRNFRTVLNGVLYRGGANNYYHRTNKRDNHNPLPNDGLENLCKEGFTNVVYLYSTNFNTAPKLLNCESVRNNPVRLDYHQIGPYNSTDIREILTMVHKTIFDAKAGPVYLHCWNGWHASGLISAYALRQFCGTSAEEAVKYWDSNTDGNNTSPSFQKIRQQIRDFKAIPDLMVSAEVQKRICPVVKK